MPAPAAIEHDEPVHGTFPEEGALQDKPVLLNSMAEKLQQNLEQVRKKTEPAKQEAKPAPKPEPKVEAKKEPVTVAEVEAGRAKPDFSIPEPAKIEKPAEAEHDDPIPETIKGKAAEEWVKIRTRAKTAETELRKAKTALEEKEKALSEVSKQTPGELAETKAQLAKYQAELEAVALERSPRFKEHYDRETNKIVALAKSVAGDKASEVEKLLRQSRSPERNARLQEIITELDGVDGDIIKKSVSDIQQLHIQRESELANAPALRQKLGEVEREEATRKIEDNRAKRDSTLRSVLEKATSLDGFREIDGDTEHNAIVAGNRDFVRRFVSGEATLEDATWTPVWAAEGARLSKTVVPLLHSKIAKLEAQLKEYQSASPTLQSSGRTDSEGQSTPKTFKEIYEANAPRRAQ